MLAVLTEKEILFILSLLTDKYGFGYSKDKEVAALQAKLSVMLEAKQRLAQTGTSDGSEPEKW